MLLLEKIHKLHKDALNLMHECPTTIRNQIQADSAEDGGTNAIYACSNSGGTTSCSARRATLCSPPPEGEAFHDSWKTRTQSPLPQYDEVDSAEIALLQYYFHTITHFPAIYAKFRGT